VTTRKDVTFDSDGDTCAAWLYPAPGADRSPIVVLGHGLGGIREMRLDAFAERFNAAGYACLVFDYRHFGSSGGRPRQLLDIKRQLADWGAAIAFARTLDGVEPDRVVLWGTSFGGGHVLVAGARDGRVAAVISQCPFTDGQASLRAAHPVSLVKVSGLALRDMAGSLLGRDPIMVPTAGPPGSAALMASHDAQDGYLAIVPDGAAFRNEVAARFALHVGLHRPGKQAAQLTCPTLFCICEADTVAPAKAAQRHAHLAPRGEVALYPDGHFDIYLGEPFERVVADQLAFLERHVPIHPNGGR
jgi:pimeloyl-ACP methyl ester carboxylesterase